VLKRWLREDENLNGSKDKMVYICELEAGENLSKEEVRLVDLMNCQEDRDEFSNFRVGNETRSMEDLMNFQEGSDENSIFQVGK
jgi:hypothetical protein